MRRLKLARLVELFEYLRAASLSSPESLSPNEVLDSWNQLYEIIVSPVFKEEAMNTAEFANLFALLSTKVPPSRMRVLLTPLAVYD